MKWNKKGHQFDTIGKIFRKRNKIFIYGAAEYGKYVYEYLSKAGLSDVIDGFVDRNLKKQSSGGYMGKPVYSSSLLFETHEEDHIIIVATSEKSSKQIMERLIRAGYMENGECFIWNKFLANLNDIYLPVYAMYVKNKLVLSSTCCIPSTVCNLRCRDCLNFTPYLKQFEIRDIEEVCKDVDLLFHWIDFTFRFQISGGEPLLYPSFNELAKYIGEYYRNKIDVYETVLNGTIVPSDAACEIMAAYHMTVYLDNYTSEIPKNLNHRVEIINQLEKYQINWIDNSVKEWFDLDLFHTDHSDMNEEELTEYFDTCNNPWHFYENGKMYACNFSRFAMKAGLNEESENGYFDFSKMNEEKKMELLEFTLNYNNIGYPQLCKKCAGWESINTHKVPVAIQCK